MFKLSIADDLNSVGRDKHTNLVPVSVNILSISQKENRINIGTSM
jgi:hypothetical protein